ncbi:hypothetical protein MRB53_015876 [Persea americana]|uniref:Uncharacterized protein n=1 Tax=Persea americana TaxID=3435 RepID=A0ACC2M1W3_PERAE|nr:hypothetical protein MRB53_015876 [Persea americana]
MRKGTIIILARSIVSGETLLSSGVSGHPPFPNPSPFLEPIFFFTISLQRQRGDLYPAAISLQRRRNDLSSDDLSAATPPLPSLKPNLQPATISSRKGKLVEAHMVFGEMLKRGIGADNEAPAPLVYGVVSRGGVREGRAECRPEIGERRWPEMEAEDGAQTRDILDLARERDSCRSIRSNFPSVKICHLTGKRRLITYKQGNIPA